jgi:hypothetical protein
MPRHQPGRAFTVGSSPENNSPNCAELTSTEPAPSLRGQRNPPASSRFVQHQYPVPSKKISRSRLRRALVNTNTPPLAGSWPRTSFTIP